MYNFLELTEEIKVVKILSNEYRKKGEGASLKGALSPFLIKSLLSIIPLFFYKFNV
jgi:hypothetical protein